MNDYMRLVAHAAAKFTGNPAVLSPLLDSYCGWENKKSRFCSEPTKADNSVILNVSGLVIEEVKVEYDGRLKIHMQHDSKILGEDNFKWSRDCTYEYNVDDPLVPLLAGYWTDDEFLIIQARNKESPFAAESNVENLQNFKLIPIDLINVLEPALNVPFLKQIMKSVKKKSSDVYSYVCSSTELSEANDVLSLLTCVPLTEDKKTEFDFEKLRTDPETIAEHSSQEESDKGTDQDKQSKKKPSKSKSKS
ncbi:hypothetical protein HNY73_022152 [Argiope bruennichi]|uniref:Uncharacterized protein n=1 Tax=Argiope bruennichi TaxID=94029 RepID=A0A8T0E2A7_ARGBR|nr:hypothetical protein HNY73_022152 [Argiope bruennichi]